MHIGDGDDDDDDDIHENSLWAYERTLPTITSTHARPQIKPTNNKVNGTRIDLFFFALRFNAEQFLIFIWTPLSLSPSLFPSFILNCLRVFILKFCAKDTRLNRTEYNVPISIEPYQMHQFLLNQQQSDNFPKFALFKLGKGDRILRANLQ